MIPSLVGRTIVVNRRPVTVVGIAARGFHGASLTASTDVWLPVTHVSLALPVFPSNTLTNRRASLLMALIARLAPDVTADARGRAARSGATADRRGEPDDARIQRWRYMVTPGRRSPALRARSAAAGVHDPARDVRVCCWS